MKQRVVCTLCLALGVLTTVGAGVFDVDVIGFVCDDILEAGVFVCELFAALLLARGVAVVFDAAAGALPWLPLPGALGLPVVLAVLLALLVVLAVLLAVWAGVLVVVLAVLVVLLTPTRASTFSFAAPTLSSRPRCLLFLLILPPFSCVAFCILPF